MYFICIYVYIKPPGADLREQACWGGALPCPQGLSLPGPGLPPPPGAKPVSEAAATSEAAERGGRERGYSTVCGPRSLSLPGRAPQPAESRSRGRTTWSELGEPHSRVQASAAGSCVGMGARDVLAAARI